MIKLFLLLTLTTLSTSKETEAANANLQKAMILIDEKKLDLYMSLEYIKQLFENLEVFYDDPISNISHTNPFFEEADQKNISVINILKNSFLKEVEEGNISLINNLLQHIANTLRFLNNMKKLIEEITTYSDKIKEIKQSTESADKKSIEIFNNQANMKAAERVMEAVNNQFKHDSYNYMEMEVYLKNLNNPSSKIFIIGSKKDFNIN